MSPEEMPNIIEKILSTKNHKIMITERGTSFGYNNLINDFRSLEIMKRSKYPIIYDATHSVQLPGKLGQSSDGESKIYPSFIKGSYSYWSSRFIYRKLMMILIMHQVMEQICLT